MGKQEKDCNLAVQWLSEYFEWVWHLVRAWTYDNKMCLSCY